MTVTLIATAEPGTPEWRQARGGRLGGSEIAAVLGLNPWESRFSLWHRKRAMVDDQPDNPAMSWGRRLEAPIAEAFAENHPEFDVARTGTWVNNERPYQLATPDRILTTDTGHGELLEVKTARDDLGWGEPGTDDIPVYYRCQVLWYLDTLGLQRAHVAVLIAGSDYREYVIDLAEVDDTEIKTMRTEAAAFMASVKAGDRPDIDSSTATYQVIKALPDSVDDIDVEIPPQVAEEYRSALAAARNADAEKRRATATVLDHIGTGRRAVCLDDRVATRTVHPDGTTRSLMPARSKEARSG